MFNDLLPGLCRRTVECKAISGAYSEALAETIYSLGALFSTSLEDLTFKWGKDLAKCMKHIFKSASTSKFYAE
jgi:hypothetical protein